MHITVRAATTDDYGRLAQIAAEGDSDDSDARYLAFIASTGRLLCATVGDVVVGFGGVVPAGDAAMVCDLFVATTARGEGVGGRLLAELLDGSPRRMTFSAHNQAALAAYRRVGMHERGSMLYLAGAALGGGSPLQPTRWSSDRVELIEYFAAGGATVTTNAIVRTVYGSATVNILRLDAADAIAECHEVLRAFDAGTTVTLYVPEAHGLAAWLQSRGFVITEYDILCTSDDVELPPTLAVLNPGLA